MGITDLRRPVLTVRSGPGPSGGALSAPLWPAEAGGVAVTASVGVALGSAAGAAAALIQRVYSAMHEARTAGRARVEPFRTAA